MKYFKSKYLFLVIFLCSFFGEVLPLICLGEAPGQNITGSALNEPNQSITSLAPSQAFNSGMIQFAIQGEGFPDHIGVKLVQNKLEIPGLYPEVSAGNRIQCFFDLSGKPFGDYDLVLIAPDGGQSIYKRAFQIRIFVLVYEINSLIKPLFFDYNQFKIREDQALVLRRNIGLLLTNP
jgi:hypothetical protein